MVLAAGLGLRMRPLTLLRAKPAHGSLLSLMGPWPWYLLPTAAPALAMLLAVKLLSDWVRRHDRPGDDATARGEADDAAAAGTGPPTACPGGAAQNAPPSATRAGGLEGS